MTKVNWLDYLSSDLRRVWLLVFAYTVVTGLLIQLVLLPYVFPSIHRGYGLVEGMDGPKFHRITLAVVNEVREEGWSSWRPLPYRQFVVGVASLCYLLIAPYPWSVLPVNATLAASAAVLFILMLDHFMHDRRRSLLAALPFIFFPSALQWNAQFHNDNYAVPGVVLILLGWALLAAEQQGAARKLQVAAILAVGVGSMLLGLVRSFILHGLLYFCIVAAVCLGIGFFVSYLRKKTAAATFILKTVSLGLAIAVMAVVDAALDPAPAGTISLTEYVAPSNTTPSSAPPKLPTGWEYTPWLPNVVDEQLFKLARFRRNIIFDMGGSTIDEEVRFQNAGSVVAYAPRALQIALFSPFPDLWFTVGKKAAGIATRSVAGVETAFAYFCYLGFPFFLWKNRKLAPLWTILFLCTAMLLTYGITVPNQGALYRFRYPYYMPIVCMGLAGWLLPEANAFLKRLRAARDRGSDAAGEKSSSERAAN